MKIVLLFFFLIFHSPVGATSKDCKPLLSIPVPSQFLGSSTMDSPIKQDGTGGFIDLGNHLVEKKELGVKDLEHFLERSKKNSIVNPIRQTNGMSTRELFNYDLFQDYIDRSYLDIERILQWARSSFKTLEQTQEKKSIVKKETETVFLPLKFNQLPKADYSLTVKNKPVHVKLNQGFEMSAIPVSQWHWVEVMLENPSYFSDGRDSMTIKVNEQWILLQPNNPVENISWCSAIVFANRRSILEGLKPAYDLSGFKTSGRAEDGTLVCAGKLIVNAPGGDIYKAEGYRLPTSAEWGYVASAVGTTNGPYHFGRNIEELSRYAWFRGNAKGGTQPLAELDPLIINGQRFYDIHGNVSEYMHDNNRSSIVGAGINPIGKGPFGYYESRGGCFLHTCDLLRNDSVHGNQLASRYTGFRLVRTLKGGLQ